MKTELKEIIEIPEGVNVEIKERILECKKGELSLTYNISEPLIEIKTEGKNLVIYCEKGNKNQFKILKSLVAHIENLFWGLDNKFVYVLEACNVHFPMTMKLNKDELIINNFLGEKVSRVAKIPEGVNVEIKERKIIISSNNRESAGTAVSNIEKATRIRNKDRRIFQDGIYLTEKPGRREK